MTATPSNDGSSCTLDSDRVGNGVLLAHNRLYPTIRRGDLLPQLIGNIILVKPRPTPDPAPLALAGTLIVQLVEAATAQVVNTTPPTPPSPTSAPAPIPTPVPNPVPLSGGPPADSNFRSLSFDSERADEPTNAASSDPGPGFVV